jgi:hypothetical protein
MTLFCQQLGVWEAPAQVTPDRRVTSRSCGPRRNAATGAPPPVRRIIGPGNAEMAAPGLLSAYSRKH